MADAFDHEAITVSSSAIGPTEATRLHSSGVGANSADISVETNNIRIRYDGSDPTAATGHQITAGTLFTLEGADNIANLKMIRETADATVRITYLI
jgi:hypothetical protein